MSNMEEVLKKFKLVLLTELSAKLIEDFVLGPKVAVSLHATFSADVISVRIIQECYGETLGTLEVKHPATVFEMWKEKHAPCWFRRRWPVRYDTTFYQARVLYPKMSYPGEVHNHTWTGARSKDE